MPILTYNQLDQACKDTIQAVNGYGSDLVLMMQLFYDTGCRPIEIVERDRWSKVDAMNIQCDTAKNSQNRVFDSSQVPIDFFTAIQSGLWPFPVSRLSQAYTFFSKNWPYPRAVVGKKEVELYAFRYRFVKKLKIDGLTDAQVASEMGWSSTSLVATYNGADIVI